LLDSLLQETIECFREVFTKLSRNQLKSRFVSRDITGRFTGFNVYTTAAGNNRLINQRIDPGLTFKMETEPTIAISETATETKPEPTSSETEKIEFKVVFNKKKFDISFDAEETVGALKSHLQDIIGVPSTMQKIMIKGLAKDEMTLKKLGVVKGSKVMVVGSTLSDVLEVAKKPSAQQLKEEEKVEALKESLSQQKQHKKIIEKGPPDDVMPGIKNVKESLPSFPLSGMLNKSGGKVRLTFKLELDQVWVGTKERTQKLPLNSIKTVTSEPIENHEEFHLLALQLGPTEASRYWIYWVPAQYVDAIKEAVLGKFQFF